MSEINHKGNGYSAEVRIQLTLNGQVLSVAQLGPDFIIIRNRKDHPPTTGEIAMWIDDYERRWKVNLPEGIRANQDKTRISYTG
jgi:hypothetical protein